jgi:hypothetical protein
MKKIMFFFIGSFLGLVVSIVLLFMSGYILEYFNIQLYQSEYDQQKNFNIFLLLSLIISLLSGLFSVKKSNKKT